MKDEDWRAEARLVALEYMVARTYNQVMKLAGFPDEVLDALEERDVRSMGLQAIGIGDPATSDYVSGELQDALRSLQNCAKEMREAERSD